jgi:hypothetical protein
MEKVTLKQDFLRELRVSFANYNFIKLPFSLLSSCAGIIGLFVPTMPRD